MNESDTKTAIAEILFGFLDHARYEEGDGNEIVEDAMEELYALFNEDN